MGAESVTVLVALGMHRRLRPEEREGLIGPLARALRVEEAHGDGEADYVDLGTLDPLESGFGIPIPVSFTSIRAQFGSR